MTRFEQDTALTRVADGLFEGSIAPAWRIIFDPNGGHLAAILLRGMTLALDDPTKAPRSLTVHFTRPPKEDMVRVETTREHSGRSISTITARMSQDGKLIAFGAAVFAAPRSGLEFSDVLMPDVQA